MTLYLVHIVDWQIVVVTLSGPSQSAINESVQINAVVIIRESVAEQAQILFVFSGSASR